MKLSILTTLLAVGLLAFAVNAEIDNGSISLGIELGESSVVSETTEEPVSTESPESTEVPETTEAPETTGVPETTNVPEDSDVVEHVPIQPRTFKTLWWLLKSILKTLRGINCTIKAVVNVKESSEQMLINFHVCGVETSKQIQAVVESAQQVINIANDIISINSSVCENPDYLSDNVDASARVSSQCVKQLRKKVTSLNSQISTTNKLIRKVPHHAGDCVTTTFSNYVESIVDFPNFVKSCAKL